jgi:hypothetical protein
VTLLIDPRATAQEFGSDETEFAQARSLTVVDPTSGLEFPTVHSGDLSVPPEVAAAFYDCESDEEGGSAIVGQISRETAAVSNHVTWLPSVLASAGLRVTVMDDYLTNGRDPVHGPFGPVLGTLTHHTGVLGTPGHPDPCLGVLRQGRPDLPGPLCHWTVGYSGNVIVVSAGRANHAGRAKGTGATPAGDGNSMFIGCEIDTDGKTPMTAAQAHAAAYGTAAIHLHLQRGVKFALRHQDTSLDGKWDLGGVPTRTWQVRVQNAMSALTHQPKPTRKTYVVVNGDTLWGIARKFHTTVDALYRWNPTLKGKKYLYIGTRLYVEA